MCKGFQDRPIRSALAIASRAREGRRSSTAAQAHNGARGVTERCFPFDPLAVFKFGPELHIHVGGRHNLTLHGQHGLMR